MLVLEQVRPEDAPPAEGYADCTIFQTDEWLSFVEETQGATRVTALLRDGTTPVGRFTGLVERKLGARILGSPFPGWSTAYMGFNLEPGVDRREAVAALAKFAFKELGCAHYELMDRRITVQEAEDLGHRFRVFRGFEIDLTQDEDSLYAGMDRNRHRAITKSQRRGVEIEETTDESFADEYYSQLLEVFGKQGLKPTYDAGRVPVLIRHLQPTGRLLLLRAREPDGRCTSTGIYLGFGGVMYSWGAASYSSLDVRHSNEALLWHAMRYWKSRSMTVFDMGGWGDYKRRYGGREIAVPWIRQSKYPGIEYLREAARKAFAFQQRVKGASAAGSDAESTPET